MGRYSDNARRFLLDTNIADQLARDPQLAALAEAARSADILITPIQGEELSRVPPHKGRREKMAALRSLAARVVPAGSGGVREMPEKRYRDSHLMESAARESSALVTEDRSLREAFARGGGAALSYAAFRARVLDLGDIPASFTPTGDLRKPLGGAIVF